MTKNEIWQAATARNSNDNLTIDIFSEKFNVVDVIENLEKLQ